MSTHDNKPGRHEPSLGDLNHLDAPAPPRVVDDGLPSLKVGADERGLRPPVPHKPPRTPPHRAPAAWRGWLWPLLTILVVAVLAWAWLNQNTLRALLPRTHLNTMLIQAGQALTAGDLEGTNGSSAQELYAKVLQEEPDNNQALKGLRAVGKAELARATSALHAHNFQLASVSLANARGLLGGGTDVDQVADALQKAQHPTRQINAMIGKAQQALAEGRVAGVDGAAALFRQVLSADSHNVVARHGLDRAGDLLATRARTALQQGDLATAGSLVDKLGTWLPHDGDLPALRAQLTQARQAPQIQAAASVAAAASVQPTRSATSVQPVSPARSMSAATQVAAAKQASPAAAVRQTLPTVPVLQTASAASVASAGSVASVVSAQPAQPAQPASAAQSATSAAIKTHLAQGEADLRQGHFTGNHGDNALGQFQSVLKLNAGNAQAKTGLQQVALALVLRANAAMDSGDAEQAQLLLARAAPLAPQSPELVAAQARIKALPSSATAAAASAPAPLLTPLQQVEVGHLLRRAKTAAVAGRIMLPPGDSAYDLYRQVLAIDVDNAAAQAGLKALAGEVIGLFNQAMAAHQLDTAGNYLVTMQSLEPGSLRATTLAQRLGNAWLDKAEQAADKGDRVAAFKALEVAKGLKPDSARLKILRAKLNAG